MEFFAYFEKLSFECGDSFPSEWTSIFLEEREKEGEREKEREKEQVVKIPLGAKAAVSDDGSVLLRERGRERACEKEKEKEKEKENGEQKGKRESVHNGSLANCNTFTIVTGAFGIPPFTLYLSFSHSLSFLHTHSHTSFQWSV